MLEYLAGVPLILKVLYLLTLLWFLIRPMRTQDAGARWYDSGPIGFVVGLGKLCLLFVAIILISNLGNAA